MNHHQRYLIEEFADEYHERQMSRRDLIRRAVLIMGSVPAGLSALAAVGCGGDDDSDTAEATQALATTATAATTATVLASPSPAASTTASAGAPRTSDVRFKGPGSDLVGYIAQPAQAGTYPGIVIIHENRGLTEHFKDLSRRYANVGFVALAVDLVSRQGGSKTDAAANTGALGSAKIEDLVADMNAYVDHLKTLDGVKPGGVGVTGFCFGGGYTFETAVASPDVKAAVPYYGTCRVIDQLPTSKAAILAMYGANDTRITSQAEQVRAALAKSGRPYGVEIYANANHAFFNDTGSSYNETAAKDAWAKTLAWFRQHV